MVSMANDGCQIGKDASKPVMVGDISDMIGPQNGPRGPGQQAGHHRRERVIGFFRSRMAGLRS